MLRQRWVYGAIQAFHGKRRESAEGPAAGLSNHYDGRRFFNPQAPDRTRFRVARRWQPTRGQKSWPGRVEDPSFPPPIRAANDVISATFIGHSTFLLQIGGVCVLTDPIWSDRCSPVQVAGPRRARRPGQSLDSLSGVDLLLVSHNHYDHMDLPTLRELRTRWAPCRDRSWQCAPSCQGGHQIGDRT